MPTVLEMYVVRKNGIVTECSWYRSAAPHNATDFGGSRSRPGQGDFDLGLFMQEGCGSWCLPDVLSTLSDAEYDERHRYDIITLNFSL
jgi:hypothetical protein